MSVRKDDGADLLLVLQQEREIWHHQIDAEHLRLREHHAAIDDDEIVSIPDGAHVHAKLAETAERDYLEFVVGHWALRTRRTTVVGSSVKDILRTKAKRIV
jgi:hypothetical protein